MPQCVKTCHAVSLWTCRGESSTNLTPMGLMGYRFAPQAQLNFILFCLAVDSLSTIAHYPIFGNKLQLPSPARREVPTGGRAAKGLDRRGPCETNHGRGPRGFAGLRDPCRVGGGASESRTSLGGKGRAGSRDEAAEIEELRHIAEDLVVITQSAPLFLRCNNVCTIDYMMRMYTVSMHVCVYIYIYIST